METAERQILISAAYKRTTLYDKSNKLYSNNVYATQAWKEISQETKIEDKFL